MSLQQADVAKVVSLGAPVLMLDTCVLLDLIRDITRKEVLLHNIQAALTMVEAAESATDLVPIIAEQVSLELQANLDNVQQTSETAVRGFREQADRIDQIAIAFGAVGAMSTVHWDDHSARAIETLNRWTAVALPAIPSPEAPTKVWSRVANAIAPSRKGKDSTKDCMVIETYLETAAQLRLANFQGRIVFGSSNTEDYLDKATRQLHANLAIEFAQHEIVYGRDFGQMKHLLGL